MLTTAEIKYFIDEDATSEKKRKAAIGQRYYEAEHDILQYRMFYYNTDGILTEDKARANSRICHPFFTEHVDQLAAYIMSFTDNPIRAKETAEGLQDQLDLYFGDEFWAEIQELITGANAKGFEYLYAFKGAEDRLAFQCADSLGVVEVRAKDTDDHCEYIIYWYIERVAKDSKKVKKIQVHDKHSIHYFVQVDDGNIVKDKDEPINPRPNIVWKDKKTGDLYTDSTLGFIPFWRLDNNRKQFSGLKPIKALIDDYDLMECGLSNNLQDFDTPIHLVKGFEGDDLSELQQNIKTKKIMGVDETGGLEILTVNVPYQARKTKADEDEKNIYRFGMALNSQSLKDTNATTNIAIKMAYTLLELKATKLEMRLKKFLKNIIKVVLDEINEQNKTDYKLSDVTIEFSHNIQINETENTQIDMMKAQIKQVEINTILNVAANIGDEQALKMICEQLDVDFDTVSSQLAQLQEEQDTMDAMDAMDDVVPEDEEPEDGISEGEQQTQDAVMEMLQELLKAVDE